MNDSAKSERNLRTGTRLTRYLVANRIALWHDAMMGAASFVLAMYLRLSNRAFDYSYLYEAAAGFGIILLCALLYGHTNRKLWRTVSLNDLMVLARSSTLAILVFYVVLFQLTRLTEFPRSVIFIHWMSTLLLLMTPRILWRLLHDRSLIEKLRGHGQLRTPVLLIGAGRNAELFIRESINNTNFPYRVVALLDDDNRNHGREMHHARIYGAVSEASYVIEKLTRKNRAPQRIILTEPMLDRAHMEALLKVAEDRRICLARMPRISELASGNPQSVEIQPVAVADILGRSQQLLDREAMARLVKGKRVMITGAGGSIGSEMCLQVAQLQPELMVLYEQSEFHLYMIDRALAEKKADLHYHPIIGDVRDSRQLSDVMAQFQPDIVFHAAAIKHVPLSETNPDQAIITNVIGSRHVADACIAHGVKMMVQVSTDKSVNPISVMGATKRVAEIYCQALAQHQTAQGAASTEFVTVRFGNVLNSAGSVVPLFQKQIAHGGPVTITHPDMTRYFMSITEAVELVLQSAAFETQDRSIKAARICVLEMGDPVNIEDLARQMIRLCGLKPKDDIAIEYVGLRAGEKLYEELFYHDEALIDSPHPSIRFATARPIEYSTLCTRIDTLLEAAFARNREQMNAALKSIVPEFTPDERKFS